MPSHSKQITAPAGYPVTLAEALDHLHLEASGSPEEAKVKALIAVCTAAIENELGGRKLVTQTWQDVHDDFTRRGCIKLAHGSVSAVNFIKYLDTNGAQQTLDPSQYQVDLRGGDLGTPNASRAEIVPAWGIIWPFTALQINAMWVEYVAGYPLPAASPPSTDYGANVPAPIKHGLLLLLGHLFENREASMVGVPIVALPPGLGLDAILFPYRLSTW